MSVMRGTPVKILHYLPDAVDVVSSHTECMSQMWPMECLENGQCYSRFYFQLSESEQWP